MLNHIMQVSLVKSNKTIMSYINENYEIIGKALAIAGLALAPLTTFFARHYSRSLYFAQLLVIWGLIFLTSLTPTLSGYLTYSWMSFMPSFTTNWCTTGDYSCKYGDLLSPGIVWLAGALFFFLLIKIIACKKRQAKFLSFYNLYKGFFYWFFGPLIYYSTNQLVPAIQAGQMSSNTFMASIIVLAILAVIVIVELIAYKVAQREEENIWRKWIEFFNHVAVAGAFVFSALKTSVGDGLKYGVIGFLAIYLLIYLIKYKFTLKVFERIFVVIQDGVILAIFIIYFIDYSIVANNALDFWALVIVIAIEIIELLIKLVNWCRKGDEDQDEPVVSPEKEGRDYNSNKKINNSFAGDNIDPEGSYDGINQNSSGVMQGGKSPKRSPPKRR